MLTTAVLLGTQTQGEAPLVRLPLLCHSRLALLPAAAAAHSLRAPLSPLAASALACSARLQHLQASARPRSQPRVGLPLAAAASSCRPLTLAPTAKAAARQPGPMAANLHHPAALVHQLPWPAPAMARCLPLAAAPLMSIPACPATFYLAATQAHLAATLAPSAAILAPLAAITASLVHQKPAQAAALHLGRQQGGPVDHQALPLGMQTHSFTLSRHAQCSRPSTFQAVGASHHTRPRRPPLG